MFALDNHTLRHQGVVILDGLTLRINAGERVALLGASGAGKSTLLSLLREQHPGDIAWCPQHSALVPALSVFHNIYMGALSRHGHLYNLCNLAWPLRAERHAIAALCATLGLSNKLYTSIDRLSGGQAQRTALGRALYTQKTTLLADEPVSSIDEHHARQLLDIALQRHDTAVVALHDQQLALDCFDRIIGLRNGQVLLDQPTAQLSLADLQPLYPAA